MNDIQEKQNTKEILEALYAQRRLYTEVKDIRRINILIILLNCFCTKLLEINQIEQLYALAIVIVFIMINLIIEKIATKKSSLAATIQEYIDRKLFGFRFEKNQIDDYRIKDIEQKIQEIVDKHKKECYKQIHARGDEKDRGVQDWYNEIPDNLSRVNAVFKCQIQNTWWEKELSKWYLNFLRFNIVIFFLITAILLWNYLVPCLLILAELVVYFINRYISYKEYENISKTIKAVQEYIENTDSMSLKGLEDLQEKIYKRRKIDFRIPDWVYKLKSINLHEKYKKVYGGKNNGRKKKQ